MLLFGVMLSALPYSLWVNGDISKTLPPFEIKLAHAGFVV